MIWTLENRVLALACLEKWRGTPHKNRIAIVGVGVDCVQLVHEVLVASGAVDGPRKFGGYSVQDGMFDVSDKLQKVVEHCLHVERVELAAIDFGDIPVFKTGNRSAHLGFCDGPNIWHALAERCVTKSQLNLWRHDIDVVYRLTQSGWRNHPQQAVKLFL